MLVLIGLYQGGAYDQHHSLRVRSGPRLAIETVVQRPDVEVHQTKHRYRRGGDHRGEAGVGHARHLEQRRLGRNQHETRQPPESSAMIPAHARLAFSIIVFSLSPALAQDRLPDGGVAELSGRGVVRAWYAQPTDRYRHGVLGDAIEGGSLVAIDDAGRQFELVLPVTQVFEDITPRIADLDGDGRNEVITIRSGLSTGASVVIYEITGERLVERAATAPLGRPNRWLSIAGIADFQGDGSRQIAIVKTPHIGGVLEILALRSDALKSLYPSQPGYSTHYIGSRILSLAGVGDVDSDGAAELALPDQSRRRLIVLRFGISIKAVFIRDLPARIDRAVSVFGGKLIAVPLETGETLTVRIH